MSELDVIVAALAAGAAAGASNTATAAVTDAYNTLKSLVAKRLGSRAEKPILSAHELEQALEESGALADPEIVRQAHALLKATRRPPAQVTIIDSQGVHTGDGDQTNYFS
ncbi:hypothetical protein KOI35_13640 [Actinoplanes bogorensis]|uniref:RHIM domain-containing protein n=1 Tax=Paractinoplanes bogorensis TaxID=1610840 RepID=A0ABS5YM49_9ACTN|nr:hypothetical protein [Actinoplanes bogorensis]MBU2664540.1 hypothetical protein [Actinoplanes bogorensis]